MVPAVFVILDAFPLNASGKLDRRGLPEPVFEVREFRAPTTPIEEIVAGVFADVLGVERVGLDDDFFALGGNSLIAVKLASALRKKRGVDVPLQWLFDSPTVGVLADRLVSPGTTADGDAHGLGVVLPIRAGGEGAPLFCIHPVTGLAWSFAGLAASIDGNRPVYGLQSPALSGARDLPGTIEEWATLYLDQIRRVQPEGPYHLLGWSMGGEIAYEMAIQLAAAGEHVATLAMLDSHIAGDTADAVAGTDRQAPTLAEMLGGGLGDELGGAGSASLDELDRESAVGVVRELLAPVGGIDTEQAEWIVDGVGHSSMVAAAYRPTRRLECSLLYFSADLDGSHGAAVWTELIDGDVELVPVPATHWDMTSPHAVRVIGPVLSRHLKDR